MTAFQLAILIIGVSVLFVMVLKWVDCVNRSGEDGKE